MGHPEIIAPTAVDFDVLSLTSARFWKCASQFFSKYVDLIVLFLVRCRPADFICILIWLSEFWNA